MKHYFQLQHTLLKRQLSELGAPVLIAYVIVLAVFIALSYVLFEQTEWAPYAYILACLSLATRMGESRRTEFLQTVYVKRNYLRLRLLENTFISLPFVTFMLYKQLPLYAGGLLLLSVTAIFFKLGSARHNSLPTPYSKKPFEFAVGFRRTWPVFLVIIALLIVSIREGNFNLGLFSLILLVLLVMSYYSMIEDSYYVWNFKQSSKQFLLTKIKVACLHYSLLSWPIAITLSLFFYDDVMILAGVLALTYCFLCTMVLAKYAAFPQEINLPQGILLAISLMFPPALVGIIPWFYSRAIHQLTPVLNDPN